MVVSCANCSINFPPCCLESDTKLLLLMPFRIPIDRSSTVNLNHLHWTCLSITTQTTANKSTIEFAAKKHGGKRPQWTVKMPQSYPLTNPVSPNTKPGIVIIRSDTGKQRQTFLHRQGSHVIGFMHWLTVVCLPTFQAGTRQNYRDMWFISPHKWIIWKADV